MTTRTPTSPRFTLEQDVVALGRSILVDPAERDLRRRLSSGLVGAEELHRDLLRLAVRRAILGVCGWSGAGLRLTGDLPLLGQCRVPVAAGSDAHDGAEAPVGEDAPARADVVAEVRASDPFDALAAAYESLLDTRPVVDPAAGTYVLETSRDRRRSSGVFYTPSPVVSRLLDAALDPLLAQAAEADDPSRALLGLRICDPSCGSGRFLVAAARRVVDRIAMARSRDPGSEGTDRPTIAREVVERCLYGVDADPVAVELCRSALWLEAGGGRPGRLPPLLPWRFLEHHILCGDGLLGATPRLVRAGIPDSAFRPLADDDPEVAHALARRNRAERNERGSADELSPAPPEAKSGPEVPESAGLAADAWCAAFLVPKRRDVPVQVTDGFLRDLGRSPETVPVAVRLGVREQAVRRGLVHWHLSFPEVFGFRPGGGEIVAEGRCPVGRPVVDDSGPGWEGGFDLVVGNPPFLNQLQRRTALDRRTAGLLQARFGKAAKGYADTAGLFLVQAVDLVGDGGRVALLLPQSVLSARDARGVREKVLERAVPTSLWVAGEPVFAAGAQVCFVALQTVSPGVGAGSDSLWVQRSMGLQGRQLPPVRLSRAELRSLLTWAPLVPEAFGGRSSGLMVPAHRAGSSARAEGCLGDLCAATADFRDQYYGLVPFVVDYPTPSIDRMYPRLVTSGLIDPARLLWGERTARFAHRVFRAPRVALERLQAEGDLGPWAAARLVPKLVLATQTRVLECVVDEDGSLLPCTPVITVTPRDGDPGILWSAGAVLVSPPVTAWALERYGGAALSPQAIKLSARQVGEVPLPAGIDAWREGARRFREASRAADPRVARQELLGVGEAMCIAYGARDADDLLEWWWRRLPPAR